MAGQSSFGSLVRHELKWSHYAKNTGSKTGSFRWGFLYVALAVVLGVALLTFGVMRGDFHPQYMWFFTLWFPWMAFGFAIHMISREWQNHTFGWWLALPYTRLKLVAAKFVAILLQAYLIYCGVFVVITLLAVYAQLLPGNAIDGLSIFLLWGLVISALFIAVFPFMAATGILFGALTRSRKKWAIPPLGVLLWAVAGGFFWGMSVGDGQNNLFAALGEPSSPVYLPFTPLWIIGILLSWLAAWFMILFAARLLERDLNL